MKEKAAIFFENWLKMITDMKQRFRLLEWFLKIHYFILKIAADDQNLDNDTALI